MKRALIGAGGFANEIKAHICNFDIMCFVDDIYYNKNDENILPLSKFNPIEYEVLVAIGNPNDRLGVVKKLPIETKYFTFIHPSAQILGNDVEIGEGSFIGANSIITTNVKLGKHSILNRGCHIGHDSIIGDYLSMMPNSVISGNCNIGDNVYIGTNTSIREKLKICNNVIIGMNSAVVKDISEPGTYVGVPSKRIK